MLSIQPVDQPADSGSDKFSRSTATLVFRFCCVACMRAFYRLNSLQIQAVRQIQPVNSNIRVLLLLRCMDASIQRVDQPADSGSQTALAGQKQL
jgi:hypothetical protein